MNTQNFTAKKEFTGRKKFLDILKKAVNHAVNDGEPQFHFFYGVGGQGKTTLKEHFIEKFLPEHFENSYVVAEANFEGGVHPKSSDNWLREIRKGLLDKERMHCKAFDLAFIRYYILSTQKNNIKQVYPWMFTKDSELVHDFVSLCDDLITPVPGIGLAYKLATKGRSKLLMKSYKKLHDEVLSDLDDHPHPELLKQLPKYLAYDIDQYKQQEASKPVILIFDHYEKFWVDQNNRDGAGSGAVDKWVRALFDQLPKGSICIGFGRERLSWDRYDERYGEGSGLHQYPLEKMNNEEADEYLRKIPIIEFEIRNRIIDKSEGLPIYLELQAETYASIINRGDKPKVEDFGGTEMEIIERFFEHLPSEEQKILKRMAVPTLISYSSFHMLKKKGLVDRTHEFNSIVKHSFFEEVGPNSYKIHSIIREWLLKEFKKNDPLEMTDVKEAFFEYFNDLVTKLEDNSSPEMEEEAYTQAAYHLSSTASPDDYADWVISHIQNLIASYKLQLAERLLNRAEDAYEKEEVEETSSLGKKVLILYFQSEVQSKMGKSLIALEKIDDGLNVMTLHPDIKEWPVSKPNFEYLKLQCLLSLGRLTEAKEIAHNSKDDLLKSQWLSKLGSDALAEAVLWNGVQSQSQMFESAPGIIENSLGNLLIKTERLAEAEYWYRESLENSKKGSYNKRDESVFHFRLARVYFDQGRLEDSQKELNLAKELIEQVLTPGLSEQLEILRLQALISLEKKEDIQGAIEKLINVFNQSFENEPYSYSTISLIGEIAEAIASAESGSVSELFFIWAIETIKHRYGIYFGPLRGLLKSYAKHYPDNRATVSRWVEEIVRINEFDIRTDRFKAVEISDTELLHRFNQVKGLMTTPPKEQFGLALFDLPFFKGWQLLEVTFYVAYRYKYYFLIGANNEAKLLDSDNRHIYGLPKEDLIITEENAPDYLRFFTDSVRGRHGRMLILENMDDLDWSSAGKLSKRELDFLKRNLAPLKLYKSENGKFEYIGWFFFKNSLFKSLMSVDSKNGEVKFTNEHPVGEFNIQYDPFYDFSDSFSSHMNIFYVYLNLLRRVGIEPLENHEHLSKSDLGNLISEYNELKRKAQEPFFLDRFESEILDYENYKEYTGVFDHLRISLSQSEHIQVEKFALPFFSESDLWQITYGYNSYFFLINSEKFVVLDNKPDPVLAVAKDELIWDEANVLAYLKFYFDFVKGRHGRFIVLENPKKYVLKALDHGESIADNMVSQIEPVGVTSFNDQAIKLHTNSILFQDSLWSADLTANRDGTVNILNQKLLYTDIMVVPVVFYDQLNAYLHKFRGVRSMRNTTELLVEQHFPQFSSLFMKYIDKALENLEERVESLYYY